MAIFNSKLAADSINAITSIQNLSHTHITVVVKNYNVPLHTKIFNVPFDGEVVLRCQSTGTNIAPGIYLIISRPALINGVNTQLNGPGVGAGLGTPAPPPGGWPVAPNIPIGLLDDYLLSFMNSNKMTLREFERFVSADIANNTGRVYQITGSNNLINTNISINNNLLQLLTPPYITPTALGINDAAGNPLNQGRTSFEIFISAIWNFIAHIDCNGNRNDIYNRRIYNINNLFGQFLNTSGFHFDYVFNSNTPIVIESQNNPYNPNYSNGIRSRILFYSTNGANITFNNLVNNAAPPQTNLNMQLYLNINDKYFFSVHDLICTFIYLKQIVVDLFISQTNSNGMNIITFTNNNERVYFGDVFLRRRAFKTANVKGHILVKNYVDSNQIENEFKLMLDSNFSSFTTSYNNNPVLNNNILGRTGVRR